MPTRIPGQPIIERRLLLSKLNSSCTSCQNSIAAARRVKILQFLFLHLYRRQENWKFPATCTTLRDKQVIS